MVEDALRVLVLGKGAREHALAWKLSQSPTVEHVFVLPGNGGTESGIRNVSNIDGVDLEDFDQLVSVAKQNKIGLVVVGPDSMIVAGVEDRFRQDNIPCFAPSKAAAAIEGSKAFAKDLMLKYGIPTAAYRTFNRSTYQESRDYVQSISHRIVIKADGLAAGKGVVLPETTEEALQVLDDFLNKDQFGLAGRSIVIEEFLEGREVSLTTLSDGTTIKSFHVGQDHKRIGDQDQGPNTGGMGVFAPVPFVSDAIKEQIDEQILIPTLKALQQEGRPFYGLLFTGVMLTETGPKVLEYNARFGDPETQSVLPLLSADIDLAQVLLACIQGRLHEVAFSLTEGLYCCGVIAAAEGYPAKPREGDLITIGEVSKGCLVFHAGTRLLNGQLVTAGGRVLTVVGMASSPAKAIAEAYEGIKAISFQGMYYRRDIGRKCLVDLDQAKSNP